MTKNNEVPVKLSSAIILFALLYNMSFANTISFPPDFFFGIATAPGHAEDQLDDIWLDFAKEGGVKAFHNQAIPEQRLRFWTQPEIEIDWAKELGVQVYRLGVDWQRISPQEGAYDQAALKRYGQILDMIKSRNMKVMLTLFHHSEPKWTLNAQSWTNPQMINQFVEFSKKVVDQYADKIDYLITFNEAQLYILLTQMDNFWPTTTKPRPSGLLDLGPIKGRFSKCLLNMAQAHKAIYKYVKSKYPQIQIGIAHNAAHYQGENLVAKISAQISYKRFNYLFPDMIINELDYLGINYYGAELIKGLGVHISLQQEYSESGRAIAPSGFLEVLTRLNERYNTKNKKRKNKKESNTIPFIITENGIADTTDWYRPAYLLEHLKALKMAQEQGIDIRGYIFWTLSDNWEWADGYCPKFGLLSVDRDNDLKRTPRPSFYLYQKIIKEKGFSSEDLEQAWKDLQSHKGEDRPFCRSRNGKDALDEPMFIPVKGLDWRIK